MRIGGFIIVAGLDILNYKITFMDIHFFLLT